MGCIEGVVWGVAKEVRERIRVRLMAREGHGVMRAKADWSVD